MNPNKALWEKGDFTRIAAAMRESGQELVEGLGVKPGLDILDLGCGDGTTGREQRLATAPKPVLDAYITKQPA